MSTREYAEMEFKRMQLNGIDKHLADCVLEIADVFDKQFHSGASGEYCIDIINRLFRGMPLTPLTGEDDEWTDQGQNKRCSWIFKNENGQAYNIRGKIFSDDGGKTWYTCEDSHILIEFPYDVPVYPEKVILK